MKKFLIDDRIVLNPVLNISLFAGVSGEIKLKSSIGYEFLNTTYYIRFENGKWNKGAENNTGNSSGFTVASDLSMKGDAYVKAKAGLHLWVFSENRIGIGCNVVGKGALSGDFSMDMQDLLLASPKVKLRGTLSGEMFCEANIFSKHFSKQIVSREFELASREYELFPVSENLTATLSDSEIDAHIGWYPFCFLPSDYGVALFDENDALLRKNPLGSGSLSPANLAGRSYTTSFSVSDTEQTYQVAPYVKFLEKEFYGEKIQVDKTASIVGQWICTGYSSTPDVYLKSFTFYENGSMASVYYYPDEGIRNYTGTYTVNGQILTLYKSNGDVQRWDIHTLTDTNLVISSVLDGFTYYFRKG